jgi:hypothetical protein
MKQNYYVLYVGLAVLLSLLIMALTPAAPRCRPMVVVEPWFGSDAWNWTKGAAKSFGHFADDLIHKPGKTLSDAADPWGKAFRWEQPWEKDVGGFFGDLVHGDQAWEKALKKEVKKDALATWVAGAKAGLAVASLPKNIATLGNQRGWQWAGDETNWSGGWGLTDDTNFLVPDSPDHGERAREGGWF